MHKKKAGCKEVIPVLKGLFEQGYSFGNQDEIKDTLGKIGVEASQITISRALQELGVKRNNVGEWVMDTNNHKLQELREIFQYAGSDLRFPRMYDEIGSVIVRTMPGYNNLIAEKIADTFPNEVLCTICPDNRNIIIYYKLKKKKKKTEQDEENDKSSADKTSENIYKKSRMRQELVKICKETRQKKKDDERDKEQ